MRLRSAGVGGFSPVPAFPDQKIAIGGFVVAPLCRQGRPCGACAVLTNNLMIVAALSFIFECPQTSSDSAPSQFNLPAFGARFHILQRPHTVAATVRLM
jgi:hypothetical protein